MSRPLNKTELNRATSPDDVPTPAFIYDDLAAATGDSAACDALVSYLVKRLASPNAYVKTKTLLIIKHVCRRGSPQFRKSMTREAAALKACLQFNGPLDPLKGDFPSRQVRESAKDALEAIYDASRDERKDEGLSGRIQGFGSAAPPAAAGAAPPAHATYAASSSSAPSSVGYPASSSAFSGAGSRYQGIGNPNFRDPRRTAEEPKGIVSKVMLAVRDRVEKYAEATQAAQQQAMHNLPGMHGIKPAWMQPSGGALAGGGGGGYAFASNRGPTSIPSAVGSYDPTAAHRPPASGGEAAPWGPSPAVKLSASGVPLSNNFSSPAAVATPVVARATTDSARTYVQRLVDDLCAPGGIRAVPPKEKLEAFVKSVGKTLEASLCAEVLAGKLTDPASEWKSQHKALCCMEALLRNPVCAEDFANSLDEIPDGLEMAHESPNAAVRAKAALVWKLLYEDAEATQASALESGSHTSPTPPAAAQHPSPPQRAAPQPSDGDGLLLIDFGDPQPAAVPAPSPGFAPATSAPVGGGSDVFGGDMFGGMSLRSGGAVAVPAAAPAGAGAAADLFSMMSLGGGARAAAPPSGFSFMGSAPSSSPPMSTPFTQSNGAGSAPSSYAAKPAPSLDDLFGSIPTTAAAPTMAFTYPAMTTTSASSSASLPGAKKPQSSPGQASNGNDAFGFVRDVIKTAR